MRLTLFALLGTVLLVACGGGDDSPIETQVTRGFSVSVDGAVSFEIPSASYEDPATAEWLDSTEIDGVTVPSLVRFEIPEEGYQIEIWLASASRSESGDFVGTQADVSRESPFYARLIATGDGPDFDTINDGSVNITNLSFSFVCQDDDCWDIDGISGNFQFAAASSNGDTVEVSGSFRELPKVESR